MLIDLLGIWLIAGLLGLVGGILCAMFNPYERGEGWFITGLSMCIVAFLFVFVATIVRAGDASMVGLMKHDREVLVAATNHETVTYGMLTDVESFNHRVYTGRWAEQTPFFTLFNDSSILDLQPITLGPKVVK